MSALNEHESNFYLNNKHSLSNDVVPATTGIPLISSHAQVCSGFHWTEMDTGAQSGTWISNTKL